MKAERAPSGARGRQRPLTRAEIVAAGLRLVERDGAAGLTMRNLANELGRVPMAVYRHIRDKRELVALLLEEVSRRFVIPQTETNPREQIINAVEHAHQVMESNGWMARMILEGERLAPSSLQLSEVLFEAMERQGLPPRQATLLHVALWQYVFGHLLIGQSKGSRMLPSSYYEFVAAGGDPDTYPAIRRMAPVLDGLTDKERFRAGLQALVDGAFTMGVTRREGICPACGYPTPDSQLDDGRGPVETDADTGQ